MTTSPEQPTEDAAPQTSLVVISPAPAPSPARNSLASVARQVSRRSIDLVAIALVIGASLSLGKQVLEWWGVDPATPQLTAPLDTLAAGTGGPMTLEFGDRPLRLTHRTITGDRPAALRTLLRGCRDALDAWAKRPEHGMPAGPTEAETQLLARTTELRPIEEQPGKWQIYQVDLPFQLLVGVGITESPRSSATESNAELPAAPATQRHLVSWAIMLPQSEKAWTLYAFEIKSEAGTAGDETTPDMPMPPESRRLLSMTDRSGGRFVGIAGEGTPIHWQQFYNGWFTAHGWENASGWREVGGHWSARFRHPETAGATVVDLQFGSNEQRGTSGVICVTPPQPSDKDVRE